MSTPLRSRQARLTIVLVAATLLGGLGFTALGTYQTWRSDRNEAEFRFQRLAERIGDEVQRRVNRTLLGLRSLRSVYLATGMVRRHQFRTYVESRDLPTDFPGTLGFGFIERVPRARQDAFTAVERADDAPQFTVKTAGDAAELYVIKIVEPFAANHQALGYDIGSEPVRRAAVERAIRSGLPALTGRIVLVQDERRRPGFLYLLPIYRPGAPAATPAEREAALLGLVYAPLLIDDVFAGLMRNADGLLDVEVFEGKTPTRAGLLLDADGDLVSAGDIAGRPPFGGRMFHRIMPMNIGGQDWTLVMTTTRRFDESFDRQMPLVIGIAGVLVSTLLAGVVFSLGLGRSRALALAEQMTASLRLSEAEARRLAVVASRTHNGVIITDRDRRIEWANEGFTRITGYVLDEVKGRKPGFLQGPLTDPASVQIMHHALSAENGFNVELINYHKSGRPYWVAIEVQPLRDAAGMVTGFMGLQSDITNRKEAEQRLVASEQRLRELTAQAPGVIFQFVVDAADRRRFAFLSAGYRSLFGRDPDEALARPGILFAAVHPDDRRAVYASIEQAIRDVEPWAQTFRITLPDQSIRWINASSSATRDADGTRNWFGMLADITEQQQARFAAEDLNAKLEAAMRQAEQAAAKAEQASVAKSQFLAAMSHEIRTPMNGVIGMTSLLLDTPLNSNQKEFAEIVRASGETLLSLINDILDFSKIESGRMDLECEPFNIRECVESTLDLFAATAAGKGIELVYEMAENVPREVRGDITRVRQILVNLVGNALKFTERGEVEVTVRIGQADSIPPELLFAVRDTGIGIPREAQPRLFKSFSQVDASTTRKYGGSGLGLAISSRLTEIMGGRMWLESEPGHGSTFLFTLRAEWIPGGSTPSVPAHADVAGKRLLVIDDNATGRRILSSLAAKWSMPVTLESRAADGLARVERGEVFDVVIVDGQMPEMDGFTFARRARALANGGRLPIVLLSSMGRQVGPEDRKLFNAILNKPAKPAQLLHAVVRAIFGAETPPAAAAPLAVAPPIAATYPGHILLAEDNPVNQRVALHMLARLGCRADTAANGVEVLSALRRQQYDLILMDVRMPEMDGLEATRRIRAEPALLKAGPWIIALTANSMEGDRDECVRAGMNDYLSKPIKTADLIDVLARACQQLPPAAQPSGHT